MSHLRLKSTAGFSLRTEWLLFCILGIGIFLRLFQFSNIPPGLFVDEAGAGYEAFSLLCTGADHLGVHLPVYFVSWGSGQSVLYSYLSIPFIAVLGLGRFSFRLLSVFVGILTLPLLYVTVKRTLGKKAALVSVLFLALMPWHVMISRWALDCNLMPFFLLLGTWTVARALSPERSRIGTVLAFLPWGLSLYAYATSYVVVPIMLVLVLAFYRKVMLENWRAWCLAYVLFCLLGFPLVLFLFKNLVTHDVLAIERFLPFGIPLLPFSRYAQITSPLQQRLEENLLFVINGFQNGDIRSSLPSIAPTFMVVFPLVLVGAGSVGRRFKQSKQADLFLLWLVACLPLFFLFDAAIHRLNAVFVPMLVVAVYGLFDLLEGPWMTRSTRRILSVGVTALVFLQASFFVFDYFFVYPSLTDTQEGFYNNLERAITTGVKIAGPTEEILVCCGIPQPYSFVAFYLRYPPDKYQREISYHINEHTLTVESLGRFHFGVEYLPASSPSFTYVFSKWDRVPCANPQVALETRLWQVGRCDNSP